MIPFGVNGKTFLTAFSNFLSPTFPVPKVLTRIETG